MPSVELPVAVHYRDPNGYDLYIGRRVWNRVNGYWAERASKWANPYKIGLDGDCAEVLAKYESHVRANPKLMTALPELAGLRLGCWCAKPGQVLTADDELRCHGQILARLYREVCDAAQS